MDLLCETPSVPDVSDEFIPIIDSEVVEWVRHRRSCRVQFFAQASQKWKIKSMKVPSAATEAAYQENVNRVVAVLEAFYHEWHFDNDAAQDADPHSEADAAGGAAGAAAVDGGE
eukprot:1342045-Pyramimonas_sp.AAC.2